MGDWKGENSIFVDLAMSDHERLPSNFKERGDFEAVR